MLIKLQLKSHKYKVESHAFLTKQIQTLQWMQFGMSKMLVAQKLYTFHLYIKCCIVQYQYNICSRTIFPWSICYQKSQWASCTFWMMSPTSLEPQTCPFLKSVTTTMHSMSCTVGHALTGQNLECATMQVLCGTMWTAFSTRTETLWGLKWWSCWLQAHCR